VACPDGECSRLWTQLPTSEMHPSARYEFGMAYDENRKVVVLFGGGTCAGLNPITLNDTWEWDPAADRWAPGAVGDSTIPSPRLGHSLGFDGVGVVLFGGRDGNALCDTWRLEGADWKMLGDCAGTTAPTERSAYAMTALGNHKVLLHGGDRVHSDMVDGDLDDTWIWNGTTRVWSDQPRAIKPSARRQHLMERDAAIDGAVLFGGWNGSPIADAWAWTGSDWEPRCTTCAPQSRINPASTYDPSLGAPVLFGGRSNNSVEYADAWSWNGSDWDEVPLPDSRPSKRFHHRMVWDGRGWMIFGGFPELQIPICNVSLLDETWVYR
jgi:hypothetical protein